MYISGDLRRENSRVPNGCPKTLRHNILPWYLKLFKNSSGLEFGNKSWESESLGESLLHNACWLGADSITSFQREGTMRSRNMREAERSGIQIECK